MMTMTMMAVAVVLWEECFHSVFKSNSYVCNWTNSNCVDAGEERNKFAIAKRAKNTKEKWKSMRNFGREKFILYDATISFELWVTRTWCVYLCVCVIQLNVWYEKCTRDQAILDENLRPKRTNTTICVHVLFMLCHLCNS